MCGHPWNVYRENSGNRAFIAECLDDKIIIEDADIVVLKEKMMEFSSHIYNVKVG